MADSTVIPLIGVNCNAAGEIKLIPENVSATVAPCVPWTGVNPRSAGAAFCVVPHPAGVNIPGGQLFGAAAVIINGVGIRRS